MMARISTTTQREKQDYDPGREGEQPLVNPRGAPADEEIAQRAYELYLARGGEDGHDLEDWLEARRQLEDPGDRDVLAHS
jgi:hypothetical protein